MYKLFAFFATPDDPQTFDRHYDEVHAPLMRKVPGLESMVVTRSLRAFGGDSPWYLIAEMTFADKEAFKSAMASPENQEAGKDVMSFAGSIVTMVHGPASASEG